MQWNWSSGLHVLIVGAVCFFLFDGVVKIIRDRRRR